MYPISQLNGDIAEDRVVLWYENFRKLLGNLPEVTDENEDIPPVSENLHIKDDIFTLNESEKINKIREKRWGRRYNAKSTQIYSN